MKNTVENLCLKFGGIKIREKEYQFKTTIGTLFVTDRDDNSFIPMIFHHDFKRDEFIKISHDNSVGEHSFKYNLHSSDKEFNLSRLEQRLDFINRTFM